jgi:hypothetical protein
MARPRKNRGKTEDRAFNVLGALVLFSSLAFIWENRLSGLGYFDGSEYALHIAGGGIAHAPGYPLFTVLCRFIHTLGPDPFLSQQVLSMLALVVAGVALHKTFELEVGARRPGFAAASAITIASLGASYLLRLFSILPEVFVLNVGLFAVLILTVTRFYHAPSPSKLGAVFFVYGLGACHHHTLAFTLPACLYLVGARIRKLSWPKSGGFAALGFAAGCLPLLYLCRAPGFADSTYYRVHDFQSLLFVLLRKGYGTFHLSPLATQTDISGIYRLMFEGLLKNFGGWGALILTPLLLGLVRSTESTKGIGPENAQAPGGEQSYRWSSPSLVIAVSSLILFFVLFVPNCNLELGVRTYRTIFLRFLTIPCFLLLYLVFKAALLAWDWARRWGHSGQIAVAVGLLVVTVAYATANNDALTYGNCDLLDEHVRQGYSVIFSEIRPAPVSADKGFHQCAIFAGGDTLLTGIKYYNDLLAKEKCYVFSATSLTGQFLSGHELRLASRTLGIGLNDLESGAYAARPEALLNLFLKLDAQGYALFVFSVTDYTGYFGKMFESSPFAYRPVGNILQVVTRTSAPFGMDRMYASYEAYVRNLENYVRKLEVTRVPTEVVDSQANQALILNLTDYAKFAHVYPAPKEAVQQLLRRAESVEHRWLALLPRESGN